MWDTVYKFHNSTSGQIVHELDKQRGIDIDTFMPTGKPYSQENTPVSTA